MSDARKDLGISHALQVVQLAGTVVTPGRDLGFSRFLKIHTHIHIGDSRMTALIITADKIGLPSLAGWFKRLQATLAHRANVNKTIKELSKLNDRELNDIGIARGDIWAIAHEDPSYKRFADTNKNLKGWV